MLVENSSKNTEKELETIDQLLKPMAKNYTQSKDDEDVV